jgi:hypothetical protein
MTNVLLDKTPRTDLSLQATAPRPTPRSGASFREVMAGSASRLVAGAEGALDRLPGGPVLAAAVRGGVASGTQPSGPAAGAVPHGMLKSSIVSAPSAPSAQLSSQPAEGPAALGSAGGTGGAGAGLESTLQGSQDMNLYYLQMQEAIAAENRSYTACSNVLKARHDTVKNAIGNIR